MKLTLSEQSPRSRTVDDLLSTHDPLVVDPEFMVFAETTTGTPRVRDLGASRTKYRSFLGGDEYNSTLAGTAGIEMFDKMRRQDATVRGSLLLAKTPVVSGTWYVDGGSDEHREFVRKCLFEWMSISWPQILKEALLCLDFGYYMFEKVFELRNIEGQNRWIWKKWAPRHPVDVIDWNYDTAGGPRSVEMHGWEGADEVVIPIKDLLVFTYDREAGNVEGISVLRSAYKHWFFKDQLYKIDAIQKERHGIGIPVIILPHNFTEQDKRLAEEMGRNLRTNEQAHIVLPPNWEVTFAKLEGNLVNCIDSIEHHDKQIAKNVLAQFLNTGAAASKEQEMELFVRAVRFIAEIIKDVINHHAIPQLIDYNWNNVQEYPRLRARRIGEVTDWRTLSFAIRNLTGAQVIRPDDEMEKWIREEMDLPPADPSTARQVAIPRGQMAGPTRQGKPSTGGDEGVAPERSGGV